MVVANTFDNYIKQFFSLFIGMRTIGVLVFILCWFSYPLMAQRPTAPPPSPANDTTRLAQNSLESYKDTFGVYYFHLDEIGEVQSIKDTALNNQTHIYDFVHKEGIDGMHLGIPGSASQPLLYQQPYRQGFDVGFHQFDYYKKTIDSIPFYYLQKPITLLSYTQLGEQSNGDFKAKFARNFAKGLQLTFDYSRLAMLGENHLYPNAKLRNTTLTTGMWYQHKNQRYDAFFTFAASTFEHQQNGGIDSLPPPTVELNNPFYATVNLQSGELRHSYRSFAFKQQYLLKKARKDSLGQEGSLVAVVHEIGYDNNKYKFFAPRQEADTLFYNAYPVFNTNYRGMRSFIHDQAFSNRVAIMWSQIDKTSEKPTTYTPNHLEIGATYARHYLDIEGSAQQNINRAFLDARWNLRLGSHLQLNSSGHLGLLKYAGDYRVEAQLLLSMGKAGLLEGTFVNQLYSPSILSEQLNIFNTRLWHNNWDKTLGTQLGVAYHLPAIRAKIGANYHLINNYIYYTTTGEAAQTGVPISIFQAQLTKNFLWKHFGINNRVGVQFISENFIRLPQLVGQHSIFYKGKWFDVLNIRIGADLRYNDTYKANYYQPVTGQFQLQDDVLIPFYPNVDAWLSLQVSNFRFYVKYENLSYQFIQDRAYYLAAQYPYMQSGFRLGLKWNLVN